jgi:large subunit ribosomal protein L10
MAISRQKKEEIVKDIAEKLSRYTTLLFVNYRGLGAKGMERVRNELRKEGIEFKVAKKTLLALTLDRLGIHIDIDGMIGQLGVVFGYGDMVAPARIIHKLTKEKEFENLKVLAGVLEKEVVGPEKIAELAALPSYTELMSKVVGSMQAPIAGFVNVLQGNMRGLVQVLNAISQK